MFKDFFEEEIALFDETFKFTLNDNDETRVEMLYGFTPIQIRARKGDFKAFLHASHQRSLERLREEVKKICDASTNLIDLEEGPTRALYEKDVLALLSTNQ